MNSVRGLTVCGPRKARPGRSTATAPAPGPCAPRLPQGECVLSATSLSGSTRALGWMAEAAEGGSLKGGPVVGASRGRSVGRCPGTAPSRAGVDSRRPGGPAEGPWGVGGDAGWALLQFFSGTDSIPHAGVFLVTENLPWRRVQCHEAESRIQGWASSGAGVGSGAGRAEADSDCSDRSGPAGSVLHVGLCDAPPSRAHALPRCRGHCDALLRAGLQLAGRCPAPGA